MPRQITTFFLGETLLGIDILLVKEVYRFIPLSKVPDTPDHIRGLMNLRGRIVTVIDLNVCLNRPASSEVSHCRLLILKTHDEILSCKIQGYAQQANTGDDIVGFLIDRMDDVLTIEEEELFPPPPNLVEVEEELIEGVIKRGNQLVILLKVSALLERVMNAVAG